MWEVTHEHEAIENLITGFVKEGGTRSEAERKIELGHLKSNDPFWNWDRPQPHNVKANTIDDYGKFYKNWATMYEFIAFTHAFYSVYA